jgi:2Fe-2S ferredoxin
MVKIIIENLGQKVVSGNPATEVDARRIVDHLRDANVDWMQGCGGKGRCTTCRAAIVSGMENLGPLTAAEQRYRQLNALGESERLVCQATISGEVRLRVPHDGKLPHLKYTE